VPAYKVPLRDMRFVLEELLGFDDLRALAGSEELSPELAAQVIEESGRLLTEVVLPLNASGDAEGCRLEDGEVRTPAGFRDAYRRFCEGGWMGLVADPAYGGQGLPHALGVMVEEMLCATNLAFSTYVGLTQGAYRALAEHAPAGLRERYLPALVSGRWAGTMCLTEPQCGTDLGLLRARAEPEPDGSYRLSGTKIFISAGEHDLAENIVHLVLARTPEAPAGTRGLSLFLVPKVEVREDGSLGARNAVRATRLERKMGIKASATCELLFEGARGWLLGERLKGMRAMFTMMNAARLAVGIQGTGVASAAYQGAAGYARERLQGRSLRGPRYPDRPADPILVHPDVKRMLLTMRALTEGGRALGAWTALDLDLSRRHPDPERRLEAKDRVALMTPIAKAFLTDVGFECANLGVQIYGGHGYIRDHGMEQLVRDARIAQIYEGTNGVQAMDLVGRKLPRHYGRLLRRFFHPVHAYLEAHAGDERLAELVGPLAKAFSRLQRATALIAERGARDAEEGGAAAAPYLRLFGLVALGYLWTRMAEQALARLGDPACTDEAGFYRAKVDTATFYAARLLPETGSLLSAIASGAGTLTRFDEAAF